MLTKPEACKNPCPPKDYLTLSNPKCVFQVYTALQQHNRACKSPIKEKSFFSLTLLRFSPRISLILWHPKFYA
jgi:hypothetical protein